MISIKATTNPAIVSGTRTGKNMINTKLVALNAGIAKMPSIRATRIVGTIIVKILKAGKRTR